MLHNAPQQIDTGKNQRFMSLTLIALESLDFHVDDTSGWGVVFSDQACGNLAAADRTTHDQILDSFNTKV